MNLSDWIPGKGPNRAVEGLQPSIANHDEAVEIQALLEAMIFISEKGSAIIDQYASMGIEASPILMGQMRSHAEAAKNIMLKVIPSLSINSSECEKMSAMMIREGLMKKLAELGDQKYSSSFNEQECHYQSFHSLSSSDCDGEYDTPSRKLFEEEDCENRSLIFSAISYNDRCGENSSLTNNVQEHADANDGDATSVDVNTSLISPSSGADVPPNPLPSLETCVDVCPQFIKDLNSAAPNLSDHFLNMMEKNNAYLQKQSQLDEGCFLLERFDSCTPLVLCIFSILKSNCNLKSFLPFVNVYTLVGDPNMEILEGVRRQMKHRAHLIDEMANEIVTFKTEDPLSFAAKTFSTEKEDANETINGNRTVSLSVREAAALAAYNNYAGRVYDELPSSCAELSHKVKNVSSAALNIVMAVRVASSIKISDLREQNLEFQLLFVLGRIIKPDLSDEEIFNMTLYQYFVDILYPTTDLPTETLLEPISISTDECQSLVSIYIQCSRFLKEEMNDRRFIDNFKKSESCSLVEDMDELRQDEIQKRCNKMKDTDYHFCGRGKNGKILAYRRQPCAATLFSLSNAKILGKMLKRVGVEDTTIEAFLFGLLTTATSKFVLKAGPQKKIPLAFLFDETNYRRYEMDSNIEDVKELIEDNIKPVIETAVLAIRDFEKKTHFSEKSDMTHFTKYLDQVHWLRR